MKGKKIKCPNPLFYYKNKYFLLHTMRAYYLVVKLFKW